MHMLMESENPRTTWIVYSPQKYHAIQLLNVLGTKESLTHLPKRRGNTMELKTTEELVAKLNDIYGDASNKDKSFGKRKWVAVDDILELDGTQWSLAMLKRELNTASQTKR